MQQQSIKTLKIDSKKLAKLAKARKNFGKVLDSVNKSLTKLTAQEGEGGDASPEEVAEALTESIIPALEQTKDMVEQVTEALPVTEEGGIMGVEGEGDDDDDDEPPVLGGKDGEDEKTDEEKEKDAKIDSIIAENLAMKKANLAQRWGKTFPPNMQKTAQEEFLEENEEEEDLEKMEAKVTSAEKVVKGYHDANLINKSKVPTNGFLAQTAKNGSKLRTASQGRGQSIPWQLRR